MRVLLLLLLALLGACDSDDGGAAAPPDAAAMADAAILDAPFQCMPLAPAAPPAACLALSPSTLRGSTPFGTLDVALDYFGAGDCITISAAQITWTGACGEQLRARFPYPVTETGAGRHVTQSFDTDARFEFAPPGMTPHELVTPIHVEVALWQEGQAMHDIDITITWTDAAFALAPVRIAGTFCDWPYYLC